MSNFIGRSVEAKELQGFVGSNRAEFIAIYGRRRIGKTVLVRHCFENKKTNYYYEFTGQKDGKMERQLANFTGKISEYFFDNLSLSPQKTWNEALTLLTQQLEKIPKNEKIVLFFDELPWLATKRSKFIQGLDYMWNTKWSKMNNLKLIVCGSAASWILNNLIHAKGGLHNRITNVLKLEPFTLGEVELFFKANKMKFSRRQILDLYLIMGGVPFYLEQIKKGFSLIQNINNICFSEGGLLFNEFAKLFHSLFNNAQVHMELIRLIATKRNGITLKEISSGLSKKVGGRLQSKLKELQAAGFIERYRPFMNEKRDHYYRVVDEYSLFYLKWIEPVNEKQLPKEHNYWQYVAKTPGFLSWSGYGFESICYKHAHKIRVGLKLDKIGCTIGSWRYIPAKKALDDGMQIDLLFNRLDNAITLCEVKYTQKPFVLDKSYAKKLAKIKSYFEEKFSDKQIFLALIASSGMKDSIWAEDLIDQIITADVLF